MRHGTSLRTLGGIGERVGDEGVVSRLAEPHLEEAPAPY